MSRHYQGPLHVYYCQAYVGDLDEYAEMDKCFAGQVNGLCGAAAPGQIHLVTGLYLGSVHITVDVLDAAPTLDLDAWEEVVEAPFTAVGRPMLLYDWDRNIICELPLAAGTYRVRYSARGMDRGHELDTLGREEEGWPADSYALMFWPASAASDVILKQTSVFAAYHHEALGPK